MKRHTRLWLDALSDALLCMALSVGLAAALFRGLQ